MPSLTDVRKQAVSGLMPPQMEEALIREVWPSVARFGPVAALGSRLMRAIVTAPLAWLMLAPFYFVKILPFLATRYTLTNRRVMRQRGLKPKPVQEVALADIAEVRVKEDGNTPFYRAATVEVVAGGGSVLSLPGVPGAEAFRQAILNAKRAWAPAETEKAAKT
jgi:hypothetical protein